MQFYLGILDERGADEEAEEFLEELLASGEYVQSGASSSKKDKNSTEGWSETALEVLPIAQQGDVSALIQLAEEFAFEECGIEHVKEGISILTDLSKEGYPEATAALGRWYVANNGLELAKDCLSDPRVRNDAECQFCLGFVLLELGETKKGHNCIVQSANQGFQPAIDYLNGEFPR